MSYMLEAQRSQRHDEVKRSKYYAIGENQVWHSLPLLYAICKYVPSSKMPRLPIKK